MAKFYDVVVIGAGQAGLVMSRMLAHRSLDHIVLERGRIAERWRTSRWDSLMFQFPNSALALPGMPYEGPDPDGFSHYTEVVGRIERYAAMVDAPVRQGTTVTAVDQDGDRWRLTTDAGDVLESGAVVVTTGPFHRPRVPNFAARMPRDLFQVHSVDYRNPDHLPAGAVLVVGSGASGCQIAEELAGAGRSTYLCLSRHRRVPRRLLGHDIFHWLVQLGVMDRTRADWVDGRMPPTVLVTGVGGGHDLDVRQLSEQGVGLLGSLRDVEAGVLHIADNAEEILAASDAMCDELVGSIEEHAREAGYDVPVPHGVPRPGPAPPRTALSLTDAGITSVVWSTGYAYDYDWLHVPCLDEAGGPLQTRGVSVVPGLYFLGLHWMHTFKSGTFMGIGDDAAHVADHVVGHVRARPRSPTTTSVDIA